MRTRHLLTILTLSLGTCTVLPLTAHGAITPGVGIGGLRVGQTEDQATSAVGKPSSRSCYDQGGGDEGGATYHECDLEWKSRKLSATLIDGKLILSRTTSSKETLPGGIGVGDTRTALNGKYKACAKKGTSFCTLGRTTKTGDKYIHIGLSGTKLTDTITTVQVGSWDTRFSCALGCG